jgi:hypothetical protein
MVHGEVLQHFVCAGGAAFVHLSADVVLGQFLAMWAAFDESVDFFPCDLISEMRKFFSDSYQQLLSL